MKKKIYILILLCLIFLVGSVSAILGSTSPTNINLNIEVDGLNVTEVEESILVKNINSFPVDIVLSIQQGSNFLELVDSSFSLNIGEEKNAKFLVKVTDAGIYNGKINVLFKPQGGGSTISILSTITVIAEEVIVEEEPTNETPEENEVDNRTDVAYVVKTNSNSFLTSELNALGLTYDVITEENVLSTDFSQYKMILVGNDKFDNPNDIPVSKYKSLIINSYHYYKKGILFIDPQFGWSSKKGTQSSPSSIKINDFNISITSNLPEIFKGYTISDPNVQTDYLRERKATGIRLIAQLSGSSHTIEDSVIAVVYPGAKFLNGNIAQKRSLFFGITKSEFWTQESKQLFRNSIMWVVIGEDRDKDGFFTDADCNDDDSGINPDATEIPYDGIDQDCSGSDLTDVDEDGFDSEIVGGLDCNDSNSEFHPNSTDLSKNCRNDAPIIGTIPSSSYRETNLVTIFISASDPDLDNVSLIYSVNDPRFNVSDNVLTWKTGFEDAGDYVFIVEVSDGDLSTSKEFFLEIREKNRAPLFNPIPDLEWDEDTNLTLNLNDYFFDEDLDSLTFSLSDTSKDTHITLESIENGIVNFSVEPDWNGKDWIIFRASDGKSSTNSNNVTLTVLPVNDPPILETQIPDLEWDEDTVKIIDLSDYFKDIDNSNLTHSFSGNLNVDVNISGSIATITGNENFNGNDSLTFKASDGEFDVESNLIVLTILPVNDLPILEHIEDIIVLAGKLVQIVPSASDIEDDSSTLTFSFTLPLDETGKWQTTQDDIRNYKTTVTVSDGNNGEDSQEVNIFIFHKILINEIVSNPLNNENEWIELYNPFSQEIDLNNCVLKDSLENSIELNGTIGEDEYSVFEMNNILSNDGDLIRLYCFDELVDSVTYGNFIDENLDDNALAPLTSGNSIGRDPNGKDTDNDFKDFKIFIAPTKGLANDADVTSPIIELLNPTNNELFNDTRNIQFKFKVLDDIAETLECELYINNNLIRTNEFVNDEISKLDVNNLVDGAYSWNIKCSDGFNQALAVQDFAFVISAPDNPTLNSIGNKLTDENKTLEFTVSAIDSDNESVLTLSAQLTNGDLLSTIGANFIDHSDGTGTFSWTPTYEQSGNYDLKFIVEDETGLKDSEELEINVRNIKKPPEFSDIKNRCELVDEDLKITIKNPDEGDDFEPGETIIVELEIENNHIDDLDVEVEVFLYDVDEEKVIESDDDNLDVDKDENEDVELRIKIPDDTENDRFAIFVIAEGENDVILCNEEYVEINIERDDNNVIINSIKVTPLKAPLGSSVDLEIRVENIGKDNQNNVYVLVENEELGISEKSEEFDIEKFGKDDKKRVYLSVKIPSDAKGKDYELKATVFVGNIKNSKTKTLTVVSQLDIKDLNITGSSGGGIIFLGSKLTDNFESENSNEGVIELNNNNVSSSTSSNSSFESNNLIIILLIILLGMIIFLVNVYVW